MKTTANILAATLLMLSCNQLADSGKLNMHAGDGPVDGDGRACATALSRGTETRNEAMADFLSEMSKGPEGEGSLREALLRVLRADGLPAGAEVLSSYSEYVAPAGDSELEPDDVAARVIRAMQEGQGAPSRSEEAEHDGPMLGLMQMMFGTNITPTTALHILATRQHTQQEGVTQLTEETYDELISCGARPDVGYEEVDTLVEYKRQQMQPHVGRTALEIATASGNCALVPLLVRGAEPAAITAAQALIEEAPADLQASLRDALRS